MEKKKREKSNHAPVSRVGLSLPVLLLMASFLLLMLVFLIIRILVLTAPVDVLATSLAVTHRLGHVGGKRLAADPFASISSFLM
jgi:hypothetical protein